MSYTPHLLLVLSVFIYCTEMTDTHILPKWLGTLGGLAIVGMINSVVFLLGKQRRIKPMSLFITVALLCFTQAVYAIIQAIGVYSCNLSNQVVGSFDNPAGLASCLSVAIPICIYLFRATDEKVLKGTVVVMAVIIGIALLISESRAGILAGLFLPTAWWLFGSTKRRWLQVASVGIATLLLSVMYIAKKNSADGRLLMLKCGWEMIKEKPLLGHGIGGVQAHYMDYQAKWLSEHPESKLSMLADNVKSVFNEFLTIGICFGIVGWLILGVFIWQMIFCYDKVPSKEGRCALMSLAAIGVLGCFSYPFSYPFTWLVLILMCYILFDRAYAINIPTNKVMRYTIAIIVFVASAFLFYRVVVRTRAELQWGQVARLARTESGKDVFSYYKALMPVLGSEPYFLYNYAVALQASRLYTESLEVALRCRNYWADYDLELIIGDNYQYLGKPVEAETCYKNASSMCPSRFLPPYKLFFLYKKKHDSKHMKATADAIEVKSVKIESSIIQTMKRIVKREMNAYQENNINFEKEIQF